MIVSLQVRRILALRLRGVFACSSCDKAYRRGYRDGRAERLASEEEVINRFHRIFYAKKSQTWLANKWLGVQTSQDLNDVWITKEIPYGQKPDFMVEAGTKHAEAL